MLAVEIAYAYSLNGSICLNNKCARRYSRGGWPVPALRDCCEFAEGEKDARRQGLERTKELTGDKVRGSNSCSILTIKLVAMLYGGCLEPAGNLLGVCLVLFVHAKQTNAERCRSRCWSHPAGKA